MDYTENSLKYVFTVPKIVGRTGMLGSTGLGAHGCFAIFLFSSISPLISIHYLDLLSAQFSCSTTFPHQFRMMTLLLPLQRLRICHSGILSNSHLWYFTFSWSFIHPHFFFLVQFHPIPCLLSMVQITLPPAYLGLLTPTIILSFLYVHHSTGSFSIALKLNLCFLI